MIDSYSETCMPYGEMIIEVGFQKGEMMDDSKVVSGYLASYEKILDFCCHHEVCIMNPKVLKTRTQKSESNFMEESI